MDERQAMQGEQAAPKPKKKRKLWLILLLTLLPVVLAGGVFAAGMMGLLKLPFLKPPQVAVKPAAAPATTSTAAPAKAPPKPTPPKPAVAARKTPKPQTPEIVVDPEKGAKHMAKLWSQMEPTALVPIAGKYRDDELARIVVKMSTESASQLLAALPAEKAVRVSREVEKLASRTVVAPEG